MFERYTEKARRAIFFARYEASQFLSPTIQSEHLLLGLLRDNKHLWLWIPKASLETIRQSVEERSTGRTTVSTSVDLPLSNECKQILKVASDEASNFKHRHIGTAHLFLAILSVDDCLATKLLREAGADPAAVRDHLANQTDVEERTVQGVVRPQPQRRLPSAGHVEIHGSKRNADYIRDVVSTVRAHNWHWQKAAWKPRDLVFHRKTGQFSFDISLAEDSKHFMLVEKGWKKDRCFICGWELFEAEDAHGTGYTNGRAWLCVECCERFVLGDYFSSSQAEMT